MPGFIITVESNNRIWYLLGTILFVLVGIGAAIGGFARDNAGLGVVGIVVAVVALIMMVDAIMNLAD